MLYDRHESFPWISAQFGPFWVPLRYGKIWGDQKCTIKGLGALEKYLGNVQKCLLILHIYIHIFHTHTKCKLVYN